MRAKTVQQQVSLLTASFLFLLSLTIGVTLWYVQEIDRQYRYLTNSAEPTVEASMMLLNGLNESLGALRGYLVLNEDRYAEQRHDVWSLEIDVARRRLEHLYKHEWTGLDPWLSS